MLEIKTAKVMLGFTANKSLHDIIIHENHHKNDITQSITTYWIDNCHHLHMSLRPFHPVMRHYLTGVQIGHHKVSQHNRNVSFYDNKM